MSLIKHPVSSIAALSVLLFAQSIFAADAPPVGAQSAEDSQDSQDPHKPWLTDPRYKPEQAPPQDTPTDMLTGALTGGKVSANLQYRFENVRQVTKLTANASTVRLRLGYETAAFKGFSAMFEAETLSTLGGNNYNSTANGKTAYATVADPEATEINQAYLSYSGTGTTVKWGRQRISLDNARFIGNVPWRQNEQTYDSFTLVNKSLPDTVVSAGYLTNVNRVFSDNALPGNGFAQQGNHKMKSPIFNVNYKGWSFAEVSGYAYLLDYDANAAKPATANSADTYGVRLNGSAQMGGNKLLYTAEFATQQSGRTNPTNYKANYTLLEGGVDISGSTFKLGYEVLGTDTGSTTKATGLAAATKQSFTTPLATLHAFNGWADMFLTTPAQGLKDTYASARTKWYGVVIGADYHDFRADKTYSTATSSGSLGQELDLVAIKTFDKNYAIGIKYMDYKAKGTTATTFAGNLDTKKLALWGEFKF